MKRSISSINDRDVNTTRLKRTRLQSPVEEEKENTSDDHIRLVTKKKLNKNTSQQSKEKSFDDENIVDNEPMITPLRSTISVSSSSLSNNTNRRKLVDTESSFHSQQPIRPSTVRSVNNSTTSQASSSRSVLANKKLNGSSVGGINKTNGFSTRTNSQAITTSSCSRKKGTITDTQRSTPRRMSQLSSSTNTNMLGTPKRNKSINSLVESTMEYRELKRLYLSEKKLCQEWRKDYQILKRQIADLRASTIPRPSADVIEWIQELYDIINNNGVFRGDGRSLKKIAEDLGLDETAMIVVSARTPQRSSLKLFRLLFPTISARAKCISISKLPQTLLDNIYLYVRTLHNTLTFTMGDMRRAIATSIRSARCEMRRYERHRDQQLNSSTNDDANDDSIELHDDTREDNEEDDDGDEENEEYEVNEEPGANKEREENIEDEDDEEEESEHTNGLFIDDEADEDED